MLVIQNRGELVNDSRATLDILWKMQSPECDSSPYRTLSCLFSLCVRYLGINIIVSCSSVRLDRLALAARSTQPPATPPLLSLG